MCRLAFFPPKFPRDKALEILLDMEGGNVDGVGSAHIDANGNFSIKKFPTSLSKIMDKGTPFLEHMDGEGHNGFTIAHLRAKSHGDIAMRNTHPFVINNKWAFMHNGTWSDHNIVRLAFSKSVKFEGETDTEVAGHLWNVGGPRAFCDTMDASGVFIGLRKDGALYAVKTSGQLEFDEAPDGKIMGASDIKRVDFPKSEIAQTGWYYFNKDGKLVKSAKKSTYANSGITYATAGDRWLPKKDAKNIPADKEDVDYVSDWRENAGGIL